MYFKEYYLGGWYLIFSFMEDAVPLSVIWDLRYLMRVNSTAATLLHAIETVTDSHLMFYCMSVNCFNYLHSIYAT